MKLHTEQERKVFRELRAEEMRTWPTKAEARLYDDLTRLGFVSQCMLGKLEYILDFFHPENMVCVEVDGGYHKKRKGSDARRDRRLAAAGIKTIRVTNAEILDNRRYGAALERIKAAL